MHPQGPRAGLPAFPDNERLLVGWNLRSGLRTERGLGATSRHATIARSMRSKPTHVVCKACAPRPHSRAHLGRSESPRSLHIFVSLRIHCGKFADARVRGQPQPQDQTTREASGMGVDIGVHENRQKK